MIRTQRPLCPKVGLLPLAFHGTQSASRWVPSLYKASTQTPHNALGRLVRLGPFLDEALWVDNDDVRTQRGGGQTRSGAG